MMQETWRAVSSPGRRNTVFLLMAVLLSASFSCEKKTILQEIEEEYGKGNYRESVFLARHHLKKGGERSPELLYITGKSFLKLGRESDADDSFAEIYSMDSLWAPRLAEVLQLEAMKSFDRGQSSKGKRFTLRAVNYGKALDFEEYNAVAGKLLLDRKDYDGAVLFFNRYLEEHADTTGAAGIMIDLAAAYEGQDETLKAIELYRLFQEKYPKSRLVSIAKWKLENLLFNAGEELFSGGETEEALTLLAKLVESADNLLVREKACFILARIFESKYEIDKAVEYYSKIVHMNLGSSSRMVGKAQERIEELEKARVEHY